MKRLSVAWKINLLVLSGLILLLGSSVLAGVLQSVAQGETQVRLALVGAATAASLVTDPAADLALVPIDVESPRYKKAEAALAKLTKTFGLSDIYVLRPLKGKEGWEFVFDTLDGAITKKEGEPSVFTVYEQPPAEVGEAWKGTEPVVTAQPYTDEFGTFRSAFLMLPGEDGSPAVVLGADFNMTQLLNARQAELVFALALAVGGLVLLVVLTWILGRMVGKPLQTISLRFAALAGGTSDLTEALAVKGHDELADLAAGFNRFVDKLRILVSDLQSGVEETTRLQSRLEQGSDRTAKTVSDIRAELETLNGQSLRLESSMREVQASLEAIIAQEVKLDAVAKSQQDATTRAAHDHGVLDKAAAELRAEADEVGQAVAEVDSESAENARRMEAGQAVLRQLQGEVQAVTGIVETLLNTSDATALLAMNASIEAAHSGNQGRGFAVIAQRMRQQAETSRADADRIGATLNGMVALIEQAASHVEQTAEGALATRDRLERTSALVGKLTASSESLESYTRRSRAVIDELRTTSEDVAQATGAMASGALTITFAVRGLQDVSQSILHETGGIMKGTENLSSVVESIQTAAADLAVVSRSLDENLRRFKTV